nr:venom peptide [Acharia stimulea]
MLSKYLIILFILFPTIFGECCRKKEIKFQMKKDTDKPYCRYYENAKNDLRRGAGAISDYMTGRCIVSLCGNGKRPAEGTYCGIGKCNVFGCNCDGGCIPGDAIEEFRKNHGARTFLIHQNKVDELLDDVLAG